MSTKIDSLTSFRFLAALAIVLFHANTNFPLFRGEYLNVACLHGVSLFFVLSGFILTTVYFEADFSQRRHWVSFLRKRIGRIWPLHVSALIFQAVAVPTSVVLLTFGYLPVLLGNIALLHAWLPSKSTPFYLNPPSWSVSTEWFFYLVFPLLLVGLRRSIWIPIAFAILSLGTVTLISNLNLAVASVGGVSLEDMLYKNPLARIPEFVAGMVTAVAFRRGKANIKCPYLPATVVELGAVAVALSLSLSSHAIARALTSIGVAQPWVYWLKLAGIPLIGFSLLIGVFAMRLGGVSRILSAPYLVLLGEISYSTYLLHVPLLMCQHEYCPELTSLSDFLLFLVILLLLSHVFYSVIEKPMREIIGGTKTSASPAPRFRPLVAFECAAIVALFMVVPFLISQRNLLCDADIGSLSKNTYAFEAVDAPLTCKMILPNLKSATIRFVWDAASDVRLDQYRVLMTLYDGKGEVVSADMEPISRFEKRLEAGQLWLSMMYISELKSRRVKSVRLVVRKDNDEPIAIRGPLITGPDEVVLSRAQLRSRSAIASTEEAM